MKEVVLLFVRALAGGALVVAFAMFSDMLKPKMFAGLSRPRLRSRPPACS